MADKTAVKDGDIIEYAREDAGGAVKFKTGNIDRAWQFVPGEKITVGTDLPTEFCERLVEDGICKASDVAVVADAPSPTTDAKPSKSKVTASDTTAGDPPAGS